MSSYLPPRQNLSSFNAEEFQSTLTDSEVETKIKTLEKQLIQTGLIDPGSDKFGTHTFDEPFSQTPVVTFTLLSTYSYNTIRTVYVTAVESGSVSWRISQLKASFMSDSGEPSGYKNEIAGSSNEDIYFIAVGKKKV